MKETFLVLGNGKSQVPIIKKILKKKKKLNCYRQKIKIKKKFSFFKKLNL